MLCVDVSCVRGGFMGELVVWGLWVAIIWGGKSVRVVVRGGVRTCSAVGVRARLLGHV